MRYHTGKLVFVSIIYAVYVFLCIVYSYSNRTIASTIRRLFYELSYCVFSHTRGAGYSLSDLVGLEKSAFIPVLSKPDKLKHADSEDIKFGRKRFFFQPEEENDSAVMTNQHRLCEAMSFLRRVHR